MPDNVCEGLFSLFTSSDRAEAIAGDLMEEREQRGWIWFWLHVVRTALTLWRNAATEAPLQVLALATAGCALLTAPAFGGAAAVRLVPQLTGSPVSWIAVTMSWWGGALWIGASLVAIAPRRGMAACATLAVAGEALLIALGAGLFRHELQNAEFVLFYAIALATAAPLLLGGAIARRRMIAWHPHSGSASASGH
jgi:hypothetical protein